MLTVDSWCFFEFELFQIKEMEDDRVTEITNGYTTGGSFDFSDRIKPLTLPYKIASEEVHAVSRRLHKEGPRGLNFPDIHRYLVDIWLRLCDAYDVNLQGNHIRAIYDELYEFQHAALNVGKDTVSHGVQLIK